MEITTSASIEIIKKNELTITKQANFYMEKTNLTKEEEKKNQLDSSNEKLNTHKSRIPSNKNKDEPKINKCKEKTSFNFNNTILNIVNDLKIQESVNMRIKQYAKENHLDQQGSIYLPQLTMDLDNEFQMDNEEGYSGEMEDFELPFLSHELTIDGEMKNKETEKHRRTNSNTILKLDKIQTAEELDNLLFCDEEDLEILNKKTYTLQTDLELMNNQKVEIIRGELLLIILKYLFSELNSGLIEISDNFVEQRILYLESDHSTYISIINLYLRKKEEYFLGVLSEIMSKLNISQNLLDNTFVYFTNFANRDDIIVNDILFAYDMVYKAGLKSTIAPRNLNKLKLKEILEFQCQKYQELIKEFNYELDVINIMVTDLTYLEYGFDKEAIRAAMQRHNVYDDKEFENFLQKLEDYQKNAFLNI